MVVYDKSIMSGEVLDEYLSAISGPIGQPSFFQHLVRHYGSRYTEEIMDRLNELGKLPVQILWGEMESINSLSVSSDAYFYIDSQGEFLYGFSPTKQAFITPLYSLSLGRKPL
jgi:hypothetical protein